MDFPTLISRTSPFSILGVLGVFVVFFRFFSILIEHTLKQTLKILIWVCTVRLCAIKRTLGLYGVKIENKEINNKWSFIQYQIYETSFYL